MLSRIAEALFWVGRYVERADGTARILDVHVHALQEGAGLDESAACRSLMAVMGLGEEGWDPALDVTATVERLAYHPTASGAVVASLNGARTNARAAREAISAEMYESLNATWHALAGRVAAARRLGAYTFFAYVKERAAMVAGLADATMPRDEGWQFLVLGRSLERADMVCRMLSLQHGTAALRWSTLLRSCGAYDAFLRSSRGALDEQLVAEFLVRDRLFPRSVQASLEQAEVCCAELAPRTGRSGVTDEALRLLGRARTSLEYLPPQELPAQLPTLLRSVQAACADVSAALDVRYFRHGAPTAWTAEARWP